MAASPAMTMSSSRAAAKGGYPEGKPGADEGYDDQGGGKPGYDEQQQDGGKGGYPEGKPGADEGYDDQGGGKAAVMTIRAAKAAASRAGKPFLTD